MHHPTSLVRRGCAGPLLVRRPPTLLAALSPFGPSLRACALRVAPGGRAALRPGGLSWWSAPPPPPPAATSLPGRPPRRHLVLPVAAASASGGASGGARSSDEQPGGGRRAATTTPTTTVGGKSDQRIAPSRDLSVLVFDAAVPSSGLAPAQVERLAAQLLPLLLAEEEEEEEAQDAQEQPQRHGRRRFLIAEGAPGGGASPALERALTQLATSLGATLALSEPPDPRRALEPLAGGRVLAEAVEASRAAGRADFAAAQQKQQQQASEQQQQQPDTLSPPTADPGPLPAASAAAPFATRVPSRRLDLPDLALRPRPVEAPGSLRRRNSSWARALELAYFLLQLNAAGIGFRLHRVGDDDSSDEDVDSDDDDDFMMMEDSSDDDDEEEDDDEDEDGTDDNGSGATTGIERASDASIRLGGPGIWDIFSGGGGSKARGNRGDDGDAAGDEGGKGGDDDDNDDDDDVNDNDEEGSGKRRRGKGGKAARTTLSITFARPDALRGDLGRKLFGGRTSGAATPSAGASLDEAAEGGGGDGSLDAAAAAAASADREAAERARLYRIAEGFETDDGDLPPAPAPAADDAKKDKEAEDAPKPPPPALSLAAPLLPAAAAAASAADAIAALEAAASTRDFDEEEEDEDGGPFEVVSVRPQVDGDDDEEEEEDKGSAEAAPGDNGNDNDDDVDDALTDEQMGAVAAEVLADAREGELRGARTLRLTGVGLGDMVLLASGLLAVSQGREPTKSEMTMLGRLLSEASVVRDDAADGDQAAASAEGASDVSGTDDPADPSNLPAWIMNNAIPVPGGGLLLPLRAAASLRLGPGTGRGLGRGRRVARGARRQALLGQDVAVRDDLSPLQRPASEAARGARDRRARALARARAAVRRRREPPGWAAEEGGAAAAARAARAAAGPLLFTEQEEEDYEEEYDEDDGLASGAYGSFEEEPEEEEEEEDEGEQAMASTTTAAEAAVSSLGGLAYASLARLRAEALVQRALELGSQGTAGDGSTAAVDVLMLVPPTLAPAVREALLRQSAAPVAGEGAA